MKKMSVLITAISLLAVLMLSNSCTKVEKQAGKSPAVPVEVSTVGTHTIDRTLEFTGNIEPWKKNNLGAQMPGTIRKIYVDVGDRVKAGELLVQMDDAQLTQARVQYELAKLDYERMKPLLDEGSISPNQFDKIKGGYQAAKAGYELTLANTQIRAPFSGLITTKWMDEGEVFTLMPGAAGSPTILTLMQINPIKISINIPESDFSSIALGQTAEMKVDVIPGRVFHGKVSRIDPAIDPMTRTFGAEIKINNAGEILRPGMFCRVSILIGSENVVAVPREALIRQLGTSKYYAFVVENGIAKRRNVKLGRRFDELFEIKSGLRDGDAIVIEGQYLLKDGMQVNVNNSTAMKQP
ncbi:MAG TPA: efflux RND transporter periplasmic adaptor subunit [Caldithrix sp.]|nr:efflux RND transporter periplasmic adaptor subunit [Caldithrix sp.]